MGAGLINVRPLHNRILVGIYDNGEKTMKLGGKDFFLLDDTSFDPAMARNRHDEKHVGIRPRWAVVMSVSDDVEETGEVKPGDKVLLEFGEWTRGVPVTIDGYDTRLWSIPVDKVLGHMEDGFDDQERSKIMGMYPTFDRWKNKKL